MKLPLLEPEQAALRRELARWQGRVSSSLLRVEATRACGRYGDKFVLRAQAALARVALVPIDDAVLDAAAALEPPELTSLDALHLATALSLGESLGVLIAYDKRLQDAAASCGLAVAAPA